MKKGENERMGGSYAHRPRSYHLFSAEHDPGGGEHWLEMSNNPFVDARTSSFGAFWALLGAIGFFGCASASGGEPQASFVASPTTVRAQQAPAVEKSATKVQAASASLVTSAARPTSSLAVDDEEPEADLVASGEMSDPQRAIMEGVGRCLERALRRDSGPGGSLALAVTVDVEGAVTQLEMGPGYPASARPCVEARVKSVRFPKDPGGGIRYYRYPINEQPADEQGP